MAVTILVVDDQDIVRDVMRLALEGAGYNVLERGHAERSDRVRTEPHDEIELVVTDVLMPEMNAVELSEHIDARAARGAGALHLRLRRRRDRRRPVHPEAVHARRARRKRRRAPARLTSAVGSARVSGPPDARPDPHCQRRRGPRSARTDARRPAACRVARCRGDDRGRPARDGARASSLVSEAGAGRRLPPVPVALGRRVLGLRRARRRRAG